MSVVPRARGGSFGSDTSSRSNASFAVSLSKLPSAFSSPRARLETLSGGALKTPNLKVTCDCAPELEHVFYDVRATPFSLASLQTFVDNEHSGESLAFLFAVRDLANAKSHVAEAQRIAQEFIIELAPRQINVSSKTRIACLEMVNQLLNDDAYEKSQACFNECFVEIFALLRSNAFHRWVDRAEHTNLSNREARLRYVFAVFLYAVALTVSLAPKLLNDWPYGPLFAPVFLFLGSRALVSGWTRVCDELVKHDLTTMDGSSFMWCAVDDVRMGRIDMSKRVQDAFAKQSLHRLSRRQTVVILGLTGCELLGLIFFCAFYQSSV